MNRNSESRFHYKYFEVERADDFNMQITFFNVVTNKVGKLLQSMEIPIASYRMPTSYSVLVCFSLLQSHIVRGHFYIIIFTLFIDSRGFSSTLDTCSD